MDFFKIVGILFFMSIFTIPVYSTISAFSVSTDDIFIKLISNSDYCLTNCFAEYTMCSPDTFENIKIDVAAFEFIDKNNESKNISYIFKELRNVSWIKKVPTYGTCQIETTGLDVNQKNKTYMEDVTCITSWNDAVIRSEEYIEIEGINIDSGKCTQVRLEGFKEPEESVDWIMKVFYNGRWLKNLKWAWWNSAAEMRVNLTVTKPMGSNEYPDEMTIQWVNFTALGFEPSLTGIKLTDENDTEVEFFLRYRTNNSTHIQKGLVMWRTDMFAGQILDYQLYLTENTSSTFYDDSLNHWMLVMFNDSRDFDTYMSWTNVENPISFGIVGDKLVMDDTGTARYRCDTFQCQNISYFFIRSELTTDYGGGINDISTVFEDNNNRITLQLNNINSWFRTLVGAGSVSSTQTSQAYPQGTIETFKYNRSADFTVHTFTDFTNNKINTENVDTTSLNGFNFTLDVTEAKASQHWICFECYFNESDILPVVVGSLEEQDVTAPVVLIDFPTNTTYSVSLLDLNISVTEAIEVSQCKYELDNVNVSMNVSGTCQNTSISGLSEGQHNILIYVNDSSNNVGVSSLLSFTIFFPVPNIDIGSPQNITYIVSEIDLNITIDFAVDTCSFETNSTNTSMMVIGNICQNTTNVFTDGQHQLKYWANTSLSGFNDTQNVSFFVSVPPVITSDSPLNISYLVSSIFGNIVSNEELSACSYQLNGVNTSMNISVAICQNTTIVAPEGSNNIKFFGTDIAGNIGNTQLVYFIVDTVSPVLTTWTLSHSEYYSSDGVDITLSFLITDASNDIDYLNVSVQYGDGSKEDLFVADTSSSSESGSFSWAASTLASNLKKYSGRPARTTDAGIWRFRVFANDSAGNQLINTTNRLTFYNGRFGYMTDNERGDWKDEAADAGSGFFNFIMPLIPIAIIFLLIARV